MHYFAELWERLDPDNHKRWPGVSWASGEFPFLADPQRPPLRERHKSGKDRDNREKD